MNTDLERAIFSSDNDEAPMIDLRRFWLVVDGLEHAPQPKRQKYNPFQLLRLRYYDDGTVAHTFNEIGAFYGIKPEYARYILNHALRELRHSRWSKKYRL